MAAHGLGLIEVKAQRGLQARQGEFRAQGRVSGWLRRRAMTERSPRAIPAWGRQELVARKRAPGRPGLEGLLYGGFPLDPVTA